MRRLFQRPIHPSLSAFLVISLLSLCLSAWAVCMPCQPAIYLSTDEWLRLVQSNSVISRWQETIELSGIEITFLILYEGFGQKIKPTFIEFVF